VPAGAPKTSSGRGSKPPSKSPPASADPAAPPKAHSFIGTAEVNAATAKMRLVEIAEEIISVLVADPQATVTVSLEITAEFPNGVSEQTRRIVSENAGSLHFKHKTWE
jgi:hypothetical protein